MRDTTRLAASVCTLLLLAACGGSSGEKTSAPPVSSQAVSTSAVQMTTPVVKQLAASLAAIGSNARVADLLAQLGMGSAGTFQLRSGIALRQDAIASAPSRGAIAKAATWIRQQVEAPTAADQAAQDFADFLSNRIFTQANLESSDATSATFLLKGSVVCADPAALPADVAACAQQLDQMQLRIRATPHGDTAIDLELLVGADRVKPVTVALTSTPSVAVTVDLGAAKTSVGVLSAALGSPVQNLPSVMQGVVTVSLKVENQAKLTIDSAISQAIDVRVDGTTPPLRIQLAPVASLAHLVADSAAQTVELGGALGNVAISAPQDDLVWSDALQGYTTVTHAMSVALVRASGTLLVRNDDTARASFDLTGLEAKQDGATLLTASLANACTIEIAADTLDFVDPLDAALQGQDAAGLLVSYDLFVDGPFTRRELCDTTGACTGLLEVGAGATFDLTGGTVLHGAPGQCVDLDAMTVGPCPAPPVP